MKRTQVCILIPASFRQLQLLALMNLSPKFETSEIESSRALDIHRTTV